MCDSNQVKVGEHLALFSYYRVTQVDAGFVHCTDLTNGQQVRIGRAIVDNGSVHSTQQHANEVKVTRTQLHGIMANVGHAAFKVTFNKQVAEAAVADALSGADLSTQAKRRKLVKHAMQGQQRVMHARMHRGGEPEELGRWKVVDLEAISDPSASSDKALPVRVVDSRTITELVVEGTRYHV
jgi:hypothetical protein